MTESHNSSFDNHTSLETFPPPSFMKASRLRSPGLAAALTVLTLMQSGCESEGGRSSTTNSAAVGAVTGGIIGAVIGNQRGHSEGGAAIGAAIGGLGGAAVGHSKDQTEERRQNNIAAERAYQERMNQLRLEQERAQADRDRQLALSNGSRMTENEVANAQRRAAEAESRVRQLQAQQADALAKHKAYQEAEYRRLKAEEEARRLETELGNAGATPVYTR